MTDECFKAFASLVNFDKDDIAEWEDTCGGDVRQMSLKMLKSWKVRGIATHQQVLL